MGRPKRLKLEQRQELARRYLAGETPKVLAEFYGVSRRHVTRLAKEERGDGLAVRDPSEPVSFRATQSELAAFDAEWQDRGFANRSQALQAMLRARCGFLDVHRDQLEGFAAACRQAQDITDAGRGLAKAVHRGQIALSGDDLAVVSQLLDVAQNLSRALAEMKHRAWSARGQGWGNEGKQSSVQAAERWAVNG